MAQLEQKGPKNSVGTLVDEGGQLNVSLAEALTVMSGQGDLHSVVDIEPLRMMIHLVSLDGNSVDGNILFIKLIDLKTDDLPSHEAKSLIEVFKSEGLLNGIPAAVHHFPAFVGK